MNFFKLSFRQIIIVSALLFAFTNAFAGGFQTWMQSGESVGNYAAGAAASANDATTVFYNPAGLTRIKHQDAAFSGIGKIASHQFRGQVTPTPAITGFTNNTGTIQGGTTRLIPTILYAAPVSDKWGFGFTMASPFTSNIDYGRNTYARYIITKNQIYTLDLGPSMAYRIFKFLSIGIGFDAQYIRLVYNQMDTSAGTTANDGVNKNTLTDWAFGWNYGLLIEPIKNTRIGVSYRSRMNHHATGDSKFMTTRGRAKLHIELPPSTIFSIYHAFGDRFALMGTANYTHWRIMQRLVLTGATGPGGTSNITMLQKLRNTWRFILGATFKPTDQFTIRAGTGFDQSPIKNHTRNLILPDSDRYIASLGFGYKLNKTMSIDFGYTHAFYKHKLINRSQIYGNETLATVGSVYNNADYFGLQFNWLMT